MRAGWIAISLLAGIGVGYAAEPVAWGPADHGLRIGLKAAPDEVSVLYQNTGPDTLRIFWGTNTIPNITLTAIAPDGKEYMVADTLLLKQPVKIFAINPHENTVEITPGASYEVKFAMKRLYCIGKPKEPTFDVLWPQHYRLRAVYKVREQDGTSGPWWTGEIRSGDLR